MNTCEVCRITISNQRGGVSIDGNIFLVGDNEKVAALVKNHPDEEEVVLCVKCFKINLGWEN